MAVKKVTGRAAIDSVIAGLEKTLGIDDVVTLGPSTEPVEVFSTGSFGLDVALGCLGIPRGRVIEIYGPESSGKTSFCLSLIKKFQDSVAHIAPNERPLAGFIDLEHSTTLQLVESIGIDTDYLLWSKPKSAEAAFQTMLDLTKTGEVGLFVLDSVDAAQTEAQLKKQIGETIVGGIAKTLGEFLRQYSKLCEEMGTTAIFINQIRDKPGVMYGPTQTTPGGHALRFYAGIRLETMKANPSKTNTKAMTMRIKIKKNKFSPPKEDPVHIDFIYGKGVDELADLIQVAKTELGLIRFAGPTCKITWPGVEEAETLATGGMTGLIETLQNQELQDKLKEACYITAGLKELDASKLSNNAQDLV